MSKSEEASESAPKFEDLALSEAVLQAVRDRGYASPTPVQVAVFEPACAGQDCVVQARTGTGKTAAFGLPLASSRVRPQLAACQALVLCPTRELALQVSRELQSLATHTGLRIASIYGGAPMARQIDELQQGAHIVVGTPGRVLDHLKRRTLNVENLRTFVLDECDEMLSMGFLPQINAIWSTLPTGQQTLLFSATMPRDVLRIAQARLRSPQFITLSGDHIGALEIQHYFYLSHGSKTQELLQLIEYESPESAIIFCNTRDETKRVAKVLQDQGYATEWLNADLGQNDRERVMKQIRDNELRFLVCTDVAARGIDISHLTHVINFDFPDSSEQYVHRTGRTGRAGRIGTALSLISPGAIGDLYYLRLKSKIHPIERHLPSREELKAREESEILLNLSQQLGSGAGSQSYLSLARRLLSADNVEAVLAGLLATQLGARDAAERQAALSLKRTRSAERERSEANRSDSSRGDYSRGDARSERGRGPRTPSLQGADSQTRQSAEPLRASPNLAAAPSDDGPKRKDDSQEAGSVDPRRPELNGEVNHAHAPSTELDTSADSVNGSPRPRESVPRVRPPRRRERTTGDRNRRHFDERAGVGYEVSEYAATLSPGQEDLDLPKIVVTSLHETDAPSLQPVTEGFVSLFVNVGKRDGASTEDIEEALDAAGIAVGDTGRILVKLKHSFVEVKPEKTEQAIERLTGTWICGRVTHVEVARPRS